MRRKNLATTYMSSTYITWGPVELYSHKCAQMVEGRLRHVKGLMDTGSKLT